MALNTTPSTPVNSNGKAVGGRGLRRRRLDHHRRVMLAADLVRGRVPFQPSYGQAAALLGLSSTEVSAAVKEHAAKDAIATLILAWNSAGATERRAAVEAIGVAVVWDIIADIVA